MLRREFIRISGAGLAATAFGASAPVLLNIKNFSELRYHKISDIRFSSVKLNYPRHVGRNALRDNHGNGTEDKIHVIITDRGASGWGLNRGGREVLEKRFSLIRGKSVAELIDPASGILSPHDEVFDFSLYDLAGNITGKPVYRLLGKRKPEISSCYSGMIYFDDLYPSDNPPGVSKILEECQIDYDLGYRQFKLKIGRGYRWMDKEKGLERDIEVVKLVSSNFAGCDILVDGNDGFTIDSFVGFLGGIGDIKLFWIEEPFRETIADYAMLSSWLKVHKRQTLLVDGEADPDEKVLQNLESQKIITVANEDISGLGFTNWIKKIKHLKLTGISASPHAWGSAIKTNYVSHLAGAFGSIPSIEGVTCSSDDVDLSAYSLKDGKILPSSEPGFGMKLLKKI